MESFLPPPSHTLQQQETSYPDRTVIPVQPTQEQEQASPQPKSGVRTLALLQFLLGLVALAIFYLSVAAPRLVGTSSRALVIVGVLLLVANLIIAVFIGVRCPRPLSKFIPILFSTVGALSLMLTFIALDVLRTQGRLPFDLRLVNALSATWGVFSGLGLGSTIMYAKYMVLNK